MFALLALTLVTAAPPTPAPSKPRIFVLDLKSDAVDKGALRALSGVLSAELQRYPDLEVLSGEDVRRALEVDADRKLAGCTADTSCLAEIAAGLGASLALSGDVEKLGASLVVNLNLFDTEKVRSLGRASFQAATLDEVPRAVRAPLRGLLTGLYRERGWTLPVDDVAAAGASSTNWAAIGIAGAGGAALLAGAGMAVAGFGELFAHDGAAAQLAKLQSSASTTNKTASLASAATLQKQQSDAGAAWNSWGSITAYAGSALVVAGVGALGGGIAWAVVGE